MLRLEALKIVEADRFTRRGKVAAWRLTAIGLASFEALQRRMQLWEQMLTPNVDIEVLLHQLRATLRSLTNRSVEGYFAGLYSPDELQRDPKLEFLKEAIRLDDSRPQPGEDPGAERRRIAAELAAQAEKEDLDDIYAARAALWR